MEKKKISRRNFLATGPAVAAGSAISSCGVTQEPEGGHGPPPSGIPLRVQSLMSVLTKKGLIDPEAVDTLIEYYETKIGPHIGARVVARAWMDPSFKIRLLDDASSAITELGLEGIGNSRADLVALANSGQEHNVVVCTLCS